MFTEWTLAIGGVIVLVLVLGGGSFLMKALRGNKTPKV